MILIDIASSTFTKIVSNGSPKGRPIPKNGDAQCFSRLQLKMQTEYAFWVRGHPGRLFAFSFSKMQSLLRQRGELQRAQTTRAPLRARGWGSVCQHGGRPPSQVPLRGGGDVAAAAMRAGRRSPDLRAGREGGRAGEGAHRRCRPDDDGEAGRESGGAVGAPPEPPAWLPRRIWERPRSRRPPPGSFLLISSFLVGG